VTPSDTLPFFALWLGLVAGVFLLHWDRRTFVAGVVVTVLASASVVLFPVITHVVRPSVAAAGLTLFMYGFQGISHERPDWLRRLLYITGIALLFTSAYIP
jgi:type IV secretory pathway VirB2 component (pilin)